MKTIRIYHGKKINFHLLPDLMEEVRSAVPKSTLLDRTRDYPLRLDLDFVIRTNSQNISTNNPDEFKEVLRNLNEPIVSLDASVCCFYDVKHLQNMQCKPHPLEFDFRKDIVEIILSRNTAENINRLFTKIEETFSLEISKPEVYEKEKVKRRRSAFVAHSFDQTGKSYAYELIKFLGLIKFEVSTGEGFSPERISKKVRERLAAQEVVIVIVSKENETTWLVQEAAGAAFIGKPLIFLIEEGFEFKPGIHGDIEYIRFPKDQISSTFIPILEGLQELGYNLA